MSDCRITCPGSEGLDTGKTDLDLKGWNKSLKNCLAALLKIFKKKKKKKKIKTKFFFKLNFLSTKLEKIPLI